MYFFLLQKQPFVLEWTGEHQIKPHYFELTKFCAKYITDKRLLCFYFLNLSTTLQLYLDSGLINGHFCDFTVEQFACASVRDQNFSNYQTVLKLPLYATSVSHLLSFCSFITQLSALTAEDLAAVLKCNRASNSSGSGPAWKFLLTNASPVLDEALDLLSNQVQISSLLWLFLQCKPLTF